MSTIGPVEGLLAYLRTQADLQRRAAAGRTATASTQKNLAAPHRHGGPKSASGAAQASSAAQEQAEMLRRRVAAIGASDPNRRRKAFRVFLESVMMAEWGQHLINDPSFYRLVDEVQAQMASREELRGMMDQAADQLLRDIGDR